MGAGFGGAIMLLLALALALTAKESPQQQTCRKLVVKGYMYINHVTNTGYRILLQIDNDVYSTMISEECSVVTVKHLTAWGFKFKSSKTPG